MYLLQYKGNLDSQTVHGFGPNSNQASTGKSNIYGVMFGGYKSTGESGVDDSSIKLFGIEDFWGRATWFLDGYYVDSSFHVLTATNGFNDTGSGYTDHGVVINLSAVNKYISGYLKDVVASPELGFTPTTNGAALSSSPCYFYDWVYFASSSVPCVGGINSNSGETGQPGIFYNYMSSASSSYFGRLCYL